jgi:hypothetical protein
MIRRVVVVVVGSSTPGSAIQNTTTMTTTTRLPGSCRALRGEDDSDDEWRLPRRTKWRDADDDCHIHRR